MANPFSDRIGVTVEEKVTNALNLSSGAGVGNIGLLVARERGIEGKAVLVNGLREDTQKFGGKNPNMYSPYVIESLFNNTGGYPVNVYQTRIVGEGSLAASLSVLAGTYTNTALATATSQNASESQPQIDTITIPEGFAVGDTLKADVIVAGTTYSATFVAATTATADAVAGLSSALNTALTGIDVTSVETDGTTITLTSVNDLAFTTNASYDATSEDIEVFKAVAGQQGEQDKGSWGNDMKLKLYPIGHTNGDTDGYKMEVYYKGYLVESFVSDGTDWQSLIDAVNLRSNYILLEATNLGLTVENAPFEGTFTGGVYNAPVEADFTPSYNEVTTEAEGMAKFEAVDVQILACPEIFSTSFATACDKFARDNKKFFLFNLPYLATESVVETYYNALTVPDQSFAASILNWCEVNADNDGNKIWIPSIGYALGAAYTKKRALHNGYVWIPPAGKETVATGVFRFTHDDLNEAKLSRFVKKWNTNVVKYVRNTGYCLWSSRTYSKNELYQSIHIRLETNWILENLLLRNSDFVQSLATPTTLRDAKISNRLWLKSIYDKGGIEQSIAFDKAVVVDVQQDPNSRKEVEIDIAWIPPECIEHIHIRLNRNDGILVLENAQ
tara:strand:+ start:31682 stop:33529 length:1848 start_codon:yes stop_codon:yes gene_type:complete